jgi:hypothetical protein
MKIGQHINQKFCVKLKIDFSVHSRIEEAVVAVEDTRFTKNEKGKYEHTTSEGNDDRVKGLIKGTTLRY